MGVGVTMKNFTDFVFICLVVFTISALLGTIALATLNILGVTTLSWFLVLSPLFALFVTVVLICAYVGYKCMFHWSR